MGFGISPSPLRGIADARISEDGAAARLALVILVTTRTRSTRKRSQLRSHPDIDRERLRRRDRAVVEQHVRYRDRDRRLRIEEGAESPELTIEQVVYGPEDLQLLRDPVRTVQVRGPVVR